MPLLTARHDGRRPPPAIDPSKVLRGAAAVLLSLAGLEALLLAASLTRAPLTLDVGPSTGAYLQGFTDSEEHPPLTFRWSRLASSIELPLVASPGPCTLTLRYARFLDEPAPTTVSWSGVEAASFQVRPGRFRVGRFEASAPGGPVRLAIRSEDPTGSGLGLAVDWVRLEGPRWRLPGSLAAPRLLVAGAVVVALLAGLGPWASLGAGLGVAAAEAALAAVDPFALAHVSAQVVLPALLLSLVCAALLRRVRGGRLVVLVFLGGYLLKAAGVFHPSYFYPDVRNHARYVAVLARAPGGVVERGLEAQVRVRTAYPRKVAGRSYAFPYSPLFFVPFTWLPAGRQVVEDALKHVGLAAAAAEVVGVFFLARAALGPGSGVVAALLSAFLPPLHSRLLLATYPTLLGHLLDLTAVVLAAYLARSPSRRLLVAFAAATLLAMLAYVSSLFNLAAFVVFLALVERRLAARVLSVGLVAAGVTVALLYLPFTRVFVGEILPALAGGGATGATGAASPGVVDALRRIPMFFGTACPLLAAAGYVVARRRADSPAVAALSAYALAFLLLVALRALAGGLFKDLKEVEFAAPLLAVTTGAFLEALAARPRGGALAAGLVVAGLVAFGLGRYGEYFAAHARLLQLP